MMHIVPCCEYQCPHCDEYPVIFGGPKNMTPRLLSLDLIKQGMARYLYKSPAGKAFHDPLAACCAINPSIGEWADVELYRAGGEWGSYLAENSGVKIIVGHDHEQFVRTLLGAEE